MVWNPTFLKDKNFRGNYKYRMSWPEKRFQFSAYEANWLLNRFPPNFKINKCIKIQYFVRSLNSQVHLSFKTRAHNSILNLCLKVSVTNTVKHHTHFRTGDSEMFARTIYLKQGYCQETYLMITPRGAGEGRVLLISSEQRPGMLLNNLQCRRQSPQERITQPKMPIVPRWRNPDLGERGCKSAEGMSDVRHRYIPSTMLSTLIKMLIIK